MSNTVHVEKGPIGKTLFSFALPVLISQLLQELFNFTDCIVVGQWGGEFALAAAGIAGLILSVFINFFIGFASGISVVTSRLFGEYNYPDLKKTLSSVFRIALLAGFFFLGMTFFFSDGFLTLLSCPDNVRPGAVLYLQICCIGIPAQLIYNVGTAVLRSLGDSKSPLYCFAASCITNLILDVVFVAVLGGGIAGAATATMISQLLLAGCIIVKMYRLDSDISLTLKGEGLTLRECAHILRIGVPSGFQAFFMSVSSLIIQVSINSFGAAAIAGMSLYAKLEGLIYLPTFAYGIALTGFVGQNYGAGRFDRIREAVRLSNRLMWAVILPLSFIIIFVSPLVLRVFTSDEAILFNAHEAILYNLPVYIIYAINQVYLGALKGLGRTFYPMVCTLACYSVFRVLFCNALVPVFHSMTVIYLSYDISFFLMLIMVAPVYRSLIRPRKEGSPRRSIHLPLTGSSH